MTVNARNEEEVDTDIIVEKLATGSEYSFRDRGQVFKESAPVVSFFFSIGLEKFHKKS